MLNCQDISDTVDIKCKRAVMDLLFFYTARSQNNSLVLRIWHLAAH